MCKKKLLIYGAGAIGRGYTPWVFSPNEYDFYFVEKSEFIFENLKKLKKFTTYKTINHCYEHLDVTVSDVYRPGEETGLINNFDAIVTAIGPRNFLSLKNTLFGTHIPIICCENDSTLPEKLSKLTGNENVVFAIPDVITSNTAPDNLLKNNPLNIVTENGVCFIDEKVRHLNANAQYVNKAELDKQWAAKLYIHNTPHCIAAYLGSLKKFDYLHEAMQVKKIKGIVEGAMNEMLEMLQKKTNISRDFLEYYRDKEISRFSNVLLYDPISRVAREPFRKLAPRDRLIGAAQLCLTSGILPKNILIGIMAAFYFDNDNDPDAHIKFLRNSLSVKDFLTTIIRLNDSEALFLLLEEQWNTTLNIFEEIQHDY